MLSASLVVDDVVGLEAVGAVRPWGLVSFKFDMSLQCRWDFGGIWRDFGGILVVVADSNHGNDYDRLGEVHVIMDKSIGS